MTITPQFFAKTTQSLTDGMDSRRRDFGNSWFFRKDKKSLKSRNDILGKHNDIKVKNNQG